MEKSIENQYISALKFNWLTPFYDLIVGMTTRERTFKGELIRQAGLLANHDVLDLASGTGTMTIWAKEAQPLAKVIGLDGDPSIIAIAERKAASMCVNVQFDRGFSYDLPYADASFDRVISSLFFHHLTLCNKQKTAKELLRVLRPGGELHVADWGIPNNKFMRGLFYAVQLLDGFETTNDNVQGRLAGLFQNAGFADVVQRKTFNTAFGTLALYSARKEN